MVHSLSGPTSKTLLGTLVTEFRCPQQSPNRGIARLFSEIFATDEEASKFRNLLKSSDLSPSQNSSDLSSVLAIPFTTFAVLAVFFLDGTSQIIATFFDFVLFIGYVTSAVTAHSINGHEDRNGELVRLVVGLVVLQLILFFITTILSLLVVRRSEASDNSPVSEKHSRFSFSRSSRGSGENRAVPSSAV
ncbi:hypothetical protein B9Z19DRAFT_1190116 [Tuber borchii]|uniref:Uncharacterized protein n=1 Tax=Tuber borchii TaxID=42251 RepID=A0A2T7A519_TUBBO|nr:hypothetical protein B9Z19DRAFT_1190116 [Tuber borchii]